MSAVGVALATAAAIAVLGGVAGIGSPAPAARPTAIDRPLRERRRRAGRAAPWSAISRTELAIVAPLAAATGLFLPPLGLAVLVVPLARRWRAARRRARARARALGVALPEAVDLLLLCAGAGLSLPLALPLVADRAPDPVGGALRDAERAVVGGAPRGDALQDHLERLGDPAAAVAHVLIDHLRYGVPLVPGLERTALELRLSRRRRAEEEARRLPVRLLAPLLTCVLPAFVLLTVVPLLVAALRSLPR